MQLAWSRHDLLVRAVEAATLGECSCGGWSRAVTTETVAVTGLSRQEALRSAHAEHAREATEA